MVEGSLFEQVEANHKLYQGLLPLYLSLYNRLKESMREISELQHTAVG